MNYDFSNIEFHDAYKEGDVFSMVCRMDDIYFGYSWDDACVICDLKHLPDYSFYLTENHKVLREHFKESPWEEYMCGLAREFWFEGSENEEDYFFIGPFMRKPEHYSLTNRYGFEGKICFVFSNNLSRDYTVDVDMPLGFEQLPVNDPRIQNLLEETLRRINDPIFEIPEIKRKD